MISREVDYAIRIVQAVAAGGGELVSAMSISDEMGIPYRFLRKISLVLVKKNILISKRGNRGGFLLARDAAKITLLDIFCAVSAKGAGFNLCLRDSGACDRTEFCKLHPKLRTIQEKIENEFSAIAISDII